MGAAIAARYWFLWVLCPACRTTQAIDLRISLTRDAATALIHRRLLNHGRPACQGNDRFFRPALVRDRRNSVLKLRSCNDL